MSYFDLLSATRFQDSLLLLKDLFDMFPKNFFKDVDPFLSWGLGDFRSLKEGIPHRRRKECLDSEIGCCDRVDVPEFVIE